MKVGDPFITELVPTITMRLVSLLRSLSSMLVGEAQWVDDQDAGCFKRSESLLISWEDMETLGLEHLEVSDSLVDV